MPQEFKYRAFITYSHHDKAWGDWLHKSLETYSIPRQVRGTAGRDGPVPARLYPVFRDREELPTAASLSEQINAALQDSAVLVVICSPNSAASRWVDQEILTFKRMGRENRILAIIVGGEPNASDKAGVAPEQECFPTALRYRLGPDGQLTSERTEPLAADARPQGDGKSNALLKVVSGALGISFDALRRREDQRRARRRYAASAALSLVVGAVGYYGWDRFDQGTLTARADPQTSVIVVDGMEVGARIGGMRLRSGAHRLIAWAPDHHEVDRTIQIPRRKTTTTRFWLDSAVTSIIASTSLQGGAVLFRSDADTVLVHNELARVLFLSTATGQELGAIRAGQGGQRTFKDIDLGAGIGRAVVSAIDRQQRGPEIIAIPASLPARTLWRWQGPPTGLDYSVSLAVVALPVAGQTTAVAAAGRDGAVHFLDGRNGEVIGESRLATKTIPFPPALFAGGSAKGANLTAFYWTGDAVAYGVDARSSRPLVAVGIDPATRSVTWRRELGLGWKGPGTVLEIGGSQHVVLRGDERWQIIDTVTGETRSSGPIKGPLIGEPTHFELAGAEGPALVLQYRDAKTPMEALRAADGTSLWQGPDRLSPLFQPRRPDGTGMLRTSAGLLLIHRIGSLAALDPSNGRLVWTLDSEPRSALTGDWDGDGVDEIFVTMRGGLLICLDGDERKLDADQRRRWAVRLENQDAKAWRMVASSRGGSTSDVLIHVHAGMIGRVQGPRGLWLQKANAGLRATPVVTAGVDGRPIVVASGNWSNDVGLRVFDGTDGRELWSATEHRFQVNRGATVADLDGSGVNEVVAIGDRPADGAPMLLSYRISDGKVTRAAPLAFAGWFSTTPVVADYRGIGKRDVAFSTWDDKSIIMADGRSGATLWRFPTQAPNLGGIAQADLDSDGRSDVVASSGDGTLYALRGTDGSLVWKSEMEPPSGGGNGMATPLVADLGDGQGPAVIAISGAGRLHVVDARTGAPRWRSNDAAGPGVCGQPVLVEHEGRKIILAPQSRAGVVAYDAASGRELWRSPAGQPVLGSPVVVRSPRAKGAAVFFVSALGKAMLADLGDGRIIWQDQIASDYVEADPVMADLDRDGHPDFIVAGGESDMTLHVLSGLGSFGSRWDTVR